MKQYRITARFYTKDSVGKLFYLEPEKIGRSVYTSLFLWNPEPDDLRNYIKLEDALKWVTLFTHKLKNLTYIGIEDNHVIRIDSLTSHTLLHSNDNPGC